MDIQNTQNQIPKKITAEKYVYTLENEYVLKHPLFEGKKFFAMWLRIHKGELRIPKGYSWDGCTPKFSINGLIVGTPDGRIGPDGKPLTYWASLVHDALYQYFPSHGIDRKEIDALFLEQLRAAGFPSAGLYHRAVRWFGGLFLWAKGRA